MPLLCLPFHSRLARPVPLASKVAVASVMPPFVVGPGVSPVPAKLVSQIVAGNYFDLCHPLPANLQVKEP